MRLGQPFESFRKGADNGWKGAQNADDARPGDAADSDDAYIIFKNVVHTHLSDRDGSRRNNTAEMMADVVNQRCENHKGEQASRADDSRVLQSHNKSQAHHRRQIIHSEGHEEALFEPPADPDGFKGDDLPPGFKKEDEKIIDESEERRPDQNFRLSPLRFPRHKDLGCGHGFGKAKPAVFFDHQIPSHGNEKKNTQYPAEKSG